MKKLILLSALIFSIIVTFAQSNSEHLTFKGVPIDGTLKEYVVKMEKAGFSRGPFDFRERDDIAVLYGDFAGFKGCTVKVQTLKGVDIVSTIDVEFPRCAGWSSLERNYELLKSMLTQKYGEPKEIVEQFQGYSSPKTNSDKLARLRNDECTWFTTYETSKGRIQLSLRSDIYDFVLLKYYDKINTDTVRAQAMNDL